MQSGDRRLPDLVAALWHLIPWDQGAVVVQAAHLVNSLHRLALGREQQDGAVVDDDLDLALVVLDVKM